MNSTHSNCIYMYVHKELIFKIEDFKGVITFKLLLLIMNSSSTISEIINSSSTTTSEIINSSNTTTSEIMDQSHSNSLAMVREHLALILTNEDSTFKDIRSNLNIFTSLLQQPDVDSNFILSGSLHEKELLMRRIAAFVSIADGIRMTFNYTRPNRGCLKCSRSGQPAREK